MTSRPDISSWRHIEPGSVDDVDAVNGREKQGRWRVCFAIAGFALLYGVLTARLVVLGIESGAENVARSNPVDAVAASRPDSIDRWTQPSVPCQSRTFRQLSNSATISTGMLR